MIDEAVWMIDGWTEALLSVADVDDWRRIYAEVAGWETIYQGAISPGTLAFLGLDNGITGQEAVVALPGSNYGRVRLVSFSGGRHPLIRSNGAPWETGGWFDLNARVADIRARFAQLQDMGFSGPSDPIEYDFGPVTVREWVTRGPDGVVLALIERVQPPLPPEVVTGRLSMHFNSTQIVSDFAAAMHFYKELLGFNTAIEVIDQPIMPSPSQNVLGLPEQVAAREHWNVAMLKAPGTEGGSVEIISFPGLGGRYFSARAVPPNRGIVSLRFPCADLDALASRLRSSAIDIPQPARQVSLPPDGPVRMMTVRGPDGARLDFYQSA